MNKEKAGLVRGVTPIYVTNRACDVSQENDPTVAVLRKSRLPTRHITEGLMCELSSDEGDKTARRAKCARKYRILLLFGDQLCDFLQIPLGSADLAGREMLFEAHKNMWGDRWFQLSNPMYGSWERAAGCTVPKKPSRLRLDQTTPPQ